MIDGIVFQKTIIGAWEGSNENSTVCTDLLHNLIERKFDLSRLKLAVIDGGKEIRKALNEQLQKNEHKKQYFKEKLYNYSAIMKMIKR